MFVACYILLYDICVDTHTQKIFCMWHTVHLLLSVCQGITASNPFQCTGRVSIWGFYPSLLLQIVCWAIPTTLLQLCYSSRHMLFITTVRRSLDKCCLSVYEMIMLASHFKTLVSSSGYCTSLVKSVLWA